MLSVLLSIDVVGCLSFLNKHLNEPHCHDLCGLLVEKPEHCKVMARLCAISYLRCCIERSIARSFYYS